MFSDTIISFSDYLNNVGYAVTPDKAAQCIASFSDDGIDCMDTDDVLGSMRFYFCKSREQRTDIAQHFHNFLTMQEQIKNAEKSKEELSETEGQKEKAKSEHDQKQEAISGQIRKLSEKIHEIKAKVEREWQPDPTKFTKTELKFLTEKKKWIDSLDMPDVEQILSGKGVSPEESRDAQNKVMKIAEASLKKGDLKKMSDLKRLFEIMKKLNRNATLAEPRKQAAVRKATKDIREKIEELKREKEKERAEHNRIQDMLSRKISQLKKASTIMKPKAIEHRQEFTDGHNAVQTYESINCPPEAELEFKKLKNSDKALIYKYIHDNLMKFKTRLTHTLIDPNSGVIDMGQTIRNACRTGGLPMNICKEYKRPGKSNLILILDVSGSCKEASEMMITFMYMLQDVFPRGCRAYAFVNSLYDITQIMDAACAEEAIRETLSIIPRAGQYSNYERPIRDMWENHKSIITKDSIVIVIGDARNNRNKPAENEFKNIVRRAKQTYWLNTDTVAKWGQGDSIAPTYARYCRMFETRTPKAIVQFIDQGMSRHGKR